MLQYINKGKGNDAQFRKDMYSLIKGEVDKSEYVEKVGRNTGYTIDPEECMADNFSYAVIMA